MTRGLGLFPSPPSKKDFEAEQLLGAGDSVPARFEELLPFVSIHDQGPTNSCVWFAIAQAIRVFLAYRGISDDVWISALFGYYNTLLLQGKGLVDKGCIPRIALQVLTQAGFCDAEDWPFDPSKVLKHPLPDAYTEANDQKLITSYYRLFSTGEDLVFQIKQALSQGYPVIYGSPIDAGYDSHAGSGILRPPTGPWLGSHMRCLVGYTPEYAIEANSWGPFWAANGLGYIGWDFVKWEYAHDFWVFDGVPQPTG